jgi:hypothetical protein
LLLLPGVYSIVDDRPIVGIDLVHGRVADGGADVPDPDGAGGRWVFPMSVTNSPSGDSAVAEIAACAQRTLAASSARIALFSDVDVVRTKPSARPGTAGRLARLVGRAVWGRVSGGADFRHAAAEGFLEPAVGRYMIDFGSYAEICADGVTFGGRSGRSLQTLRPASRHEGNVLWLLRLVPGTTDARLEGAETLRGSLCRKYTARVEVPRAVAASGTSGLPPQSGVVSPQPPVLALVVWIDDRHVRQVRFEDRVPKDLRAEQRTSVAKVLTLELWDFGVLVQELDWSRLPDFRTQPP